MLKITKTNKYLASLAFNQRKQYFVFKRLKNPLTFNLQSLLYMYNINSFDTCIDWLNENKEIPYSRKKRLLDICWNQYIIDADIINDNIVNYYLEFINKYWNISNCASNSLNTILVSYFNDNKQIWNNITFHTNNIKEIIVKKHSSNI